MATADQSLEIRRQNAKQTDTLLDMLNKLEEAGVNIGDAKSSLKPTQSNLKKSDDNLIVNRLVKYQEPTFDLETLYSGNKFTRKYHLLIKTRYYYYLYSTVARCGYLPVVCMYQLDAGTLQSRNLLTNVA